MGLIKSISAPAELTSFSMRDIELQAQSLLVRARKAAELLLMEAQKEGEAIKSHAHAEGLAQGHAQGLEQGKAEGRKSGHSAALLETKAQMTAVWTALTAAVGQLEAARRDLESEALTEVIELAGNIARRVTKIQAQMDPNVLVENLREAMKLAVQSSDVRIVINPIQRKALLDELPKLQLHWPDLKHVELVDDQSVTAGGCRILTRNGEIDAQIDQQLDRVIGELLPGKDIVR